MKSTRLQGKVTKDHPLHKLYEASTDIVKRAKQAYNNSGVPIPESFCLPIWMDSDPVMKITIEVGSQTTAEYAIYKAQNK